MSSHFISLSVVATHFISNSLDVTIFLSASSIANLNQQEVNKIHNVNDAITIQSFQLSTVKLARPPPPSLPPPPSPSLFSCLTAKCTLLNDEKCMSSETVLHHKLLCNNTRLG